MQKYLMLSNLTERGRARIRDNPHRVLEVNQEVEEHGCRILAQYALLGEYSFATIIEVPDNAAMYRLAIELGARGTVNTTTMPAIETDEFIADMESWIQSK